MNKPNSSQFHFKLSPVATSVLVVLSQLTVGVAQAGSGFGSGNYVANPALTIPVPTYYANSPAGPAVDLRTGAGAVTLDVNNMPVTTTTGKALRKFVDTLPGVAGLNASGFLGGANNLGQVIPMAKPEKWINTNGAVTGDDYYEIAAIEYTEQLHSDLPKATRLRGYVQLSTATNPGAHLELKYIGGAPILDASGAQVYAYAAPHHLGPIISATSGVPVRVKFTNYLPVGGNLFLPVDKTLPGAGLSADGLTYYTENRAEIHLVGGQAPWISAGSPHQWVAPKGETAAYAAGLGKGPSNADVPDMQPSGPGTTTLYFPNAQSARMSFYQDRTSGLTRLNAYAGMAAGYLVTDPTEQGLVTSGAIPADQIPLILEDKTFVPSNITQQDAKWDAGHWGGAGDLWFPHVYETNQDPASIDGANPVGRWDYGPWFWPIFPATVALPTGEYGNASFTPEAYHDTPLVNGTAYPTLTVDPKAYRIRILNASSDRYFNLGFYKADKTVVAPILDSNGFPTFDAATGAPLVRRNTEVKMVPAVADVTGAPATPVSLEVPYDPNCLCQYSKLQQLQPAIQFSGPNRAWPKDNRVGGAPDPTAVGPDFISIGTDGGLLPMPVDVPSQPVTYEANRRSVTVTNVYGYGMLVGPAERADTVVDFSAYAGQTLILYNDAPAPFPFNDQRLDYYTGNPDQTSSGGTYSTQPGYGPNTRTVMQIVVNAAPVADTGKFSADALNVSLPAAYAASQPKPIVPAALYNAAFNTNDTDVYAHVATGSVAQPNLDFTTSGVNLTIDAVNMVSSGGQLVVGTTNIVGNANPGSGQGYDPLNPPTVVFNDTGCLPNGGVPALAHAIVDAASHQVTKVVMDRNGTGYSCAPPVTFLGGSGVGAQATVHTTSNNTQSYLVQTKAEQELFDTVGRYNSTGGVELPLTSGTTQTTIPLSYIDAPTEFLKDGEVQLWKIVDNGLWTNSMHFGFVDVQLINRVGWDGTVKAPASNEVGWKDTLRLNPLEDVIVAMRPKAAPTPFGLPASVRSLDPSVALGAPGSNIGFMADPGVVDPVTGAALLTNTTNITQNFDNEFFWGSAILSHAEDDLLRPVVFHPTVTAPTAPSGLAGAAGAVRWTDATPALAATTLSNPANEVGFLVKRAVFAKNAAGDYVAGAYGQIASLPANTTGYTDTQLVATVDYAYKVIAYNNAGSADSLPYVEINVPAVPTWSAVPSINNADGAVTLRWNAAAGATGYTITANGQPFGGVIAAVAGNLQTAVVNLPLNVNYTSITVTALKSISGYATVSSLPSTAQQANLLLVVAAPTNFKAGVPNTTTGDTALSWTNVTGAAITYQVSVDNAAPVAITNGSAIALTGGVVHSLSLTAVGTVYGQTGVTSNPITTTVDMTVAAPSAPYGFTYTVDNATGAVKVNWSNSATAGVTYAISVDGAANQPQVNGGVMTMGLNAVHTLNLVAVTTRYGMQFVSAAVPMTVNLVPGPLAAPAALNASARTGGDVVLTWTVVAGNSYQVSVDGGAYVPIVSGAIVTPRMAVGLVHNIGVIATGPVMGTPVTSAAATTTVDLTPYGMPSPTNFAAGVPNTTTGTTRLTWVGITNARAVGAYYQVSVDGAAPVRLASGGSVTLTGGVVHDLSLTTVGTIAGVVYTSAPVTVAVDMTVVAPAAPTVPTFAVNATTGVVTLNWTNSTTAGVTYVLSVDGAAPVAIAKNTALAPALALNALHNLNLYAVTTMYGKQYLSAVTPLVVDLRPVPLAAPVGVTATVAAANGAVTLNWTAVTGMSYLVSVDGGAYTAMARNTVITPALAIGSVHTVSLEAQGPVLGTQETSAPTSVTVDLTLPTLSAPVIGATTPTAAGRSTLTWPAIANATGYTVVVTSPALATPISAPVINATYNLTGLVAGNVYSISVTPTGTRYGQALASTVGTLSLPVAPLATTAVGVTRGTTGTLTDTLTWTNATAGATWTIVRTDVTTGKTVTLATPLPVAGIYTLVDHFGLVATQVYYYTISGSSGTGAITAVNSAQVTAR